jgi:hypothetical protein
LDLLDPDELRLLRAEVGNLIGFNDGTILHKLVCWMSLEFKPLNRAINDIYLSIAKKCG